MVDLLEAERDTRVETLAEGDLFRWLGEVHTVRRRRSGTGIPALVGYPLPVRWAPKVAVETTTPSRWGGYVTFLFPEGHFVAAHTPR